MKNIFRISIVAAFLLLIVSSCDNGFDSLNTSKTSPVSVDPVYLLNGAVINTSYTTGVAGGHVLIYDMGVVQQIISPQAGVVAGANFNQDNRDATASLWENYYPNVIRATRDVISITEGRAERSNLRNMARILQAYAFLVLTDEYGDIPYFEGGLGFVDLISFPKYDAQEDVYDDIIKELGEAAAGLNTSANIETTDVLYGGDIDQWKKFAYSLMLRAGMRLSKVNATKAESVVADAFAGGVITDNADNAMIRHDFNYQNGTGNTLNTTEAANYYLTDAFVVALDSTDDPRMEAMVVRYPTATSGEGQSPDNADTDPDNQIGMPVGSKDNSPLSPGLTSFYQYSQVDRTRIAKRDSPIFMVTAAQTQLLLAEAAFYGWIAGAEDEYYEAGIRAHMEQLSSYDINSTIDPADIDTYITNNPYSAVTALEQINTQYWIASFLNGPEAFANFRRSGFPNLTPNPLTSPEMDGEEFIRRLTYPITELSVNTDNVNEAINRMGPDILGTRVWWDAP